jgi:MFS transporter, DHA1 family, inner membrane transport protein
VKAIAALAALSVSTFVYVTVETVPVGLLLPMAAGLHVSASAIGLLVTWYGLAVVLTSIPLTRLTRRVPRRYLLTGLLAGSAVATWVAAVAPSYPVVLAARVATALTQALFWSLVVPTAAGLFPARVRGRVVAVVFAGSSLATVLGVPAGTWLGQQVGWRVSFLALGGLAAATAAALAVLLPTTAPNTGPTARGTAPDARRYRLLIVSTALAVTGTFASFTYLAPFLTTAGGFPPTAISSLLVLRGAAGVVGVLAGGPLADHRPRVSVLVPVALQAGALLGLSAFAGLPALTVTFVALSGFAFAALTTALGSRVLDVAPGSTDLAAAGASSAVNAGITLGALLGALVLPAFGAEGTTLAGGLLSLAALAVVLAEAQPRASIAAPPEDRNPQSVHQITEPTTP